MSLSTQGSLTLADYGYDSQGRVSTLARNNGLIQTTWTYDNVDRVTDLLTSVSGDPLGDNPQPVPVQPMVVQNWREN